MRRSARRCRWTLNPRMSDRSTCVTSVLAVVLAGVSAVVASVLVAASVVLVMMSRRICMVSDEENGDDRRHDHEAARRSWCMSRWRKRGVMSERLL